MLRDQLEGMYITTPPDKNDDDPQHPAWGHVGVGKATIGFRYASAVIRTTRAYAELSQRELAERTGVSLSTISRIEGNHGSPRWATVEQCVRACECRFALVTGDDEVIDYAPLVLERDRAGRH